MDIDRNPRTTDVATIRSSRRLLARLSSTGILEVSVGEFEPEGVAKVLHDNSIDARLFRGMLDHLDDSQPGDFDLITDRRATEHNGPCIIIACPGCGATSVLRIGINDTLMGVQRWVLSGSPTHPTLRPSVQHDDCWMGRLSDGYWKSY